MVSYLKEALQRIRGKEVASNFNIEKELNYALSLPEQHIRRLGVYHPSGLRGCRRALAFGRIEYPRSPVKFDTDLEFIFLMGHAMHDMVQGLLIRHPDIGFEKEVSVKSEKLKIYGHCDGVITLPDFTKLGIEIKSISPTQFVALKSPKPDHYFQASIYGILLGLSKIIILYVSKAYPPRYTYTADKQHKGLFRRVATNVTDTKWRAFELPPAREMLDEAITTIHYVEEHLESGAMPPRQIEDWCKTCPWKMPCFGGQNEMEIPKGYGIVERVDFTGYRDSGTVEAAGALSA